MLKIIRITIAAFLFTTAVCSCSAADNDLTARLIHALHKAEITDVPLHVTNTAEYLPLAMRYIQTFGFDEHADGLLRYAVSVKPSNYTHLVNYYLKELLKANNKTSFDRIYSVHRSAVLPAYTQIFELYHQNNPDFISHLSELPSSKARSPYGVMAKTAEFLPTIVSYITLYPEVLCANQVEIYLSYACFNIEDDDDKEYFDTIVHHFSDSPTLILIHSLLLKDKRTAEKYLSSALAYEANHINNNNTETQMFDKIDMIKNIAIKLGLRGVFSSAVSNFKDRYDIFNYYYCEEQLYFHGTEKGLSAYKTLYDRYSNSKTALGRRIRSKVLTLSPSATDTWVSNVIRFYNDYKTSKDAQNLLNLMVRTVMKSKSRSCLISQVSHIDLSAMSETDKVYFWYDMYLIDGANPKWREQIDRYPFSYPSLVLHNGLSNHFFPVKNDPAPLTSLGSTVMQNVQAFLTIGLANEINYDAISSLNGSDKYHIYEAIGNHYNKHENYLMGIKYHILKCDSFYQTGYTDITMKDFRILYPLHYKDLVIKYSKQNKVDPAFAYGIMREESRFNHAIESYVGAVGLMQIMPTTGKWIADRTKVKDYDLANPADNIRMGTYYLDFLTYYTDDMRFIAAGYNAGPGRAKQWIAEFKNNTALEKTELIPIHETRNYVRRVMNSYYIYKYLLKQ
ncbi:MAG: lytic transglycosylase domain-containing protein [Spirochaetales bacterium]|nr:lytic transglycosylase domain-containing protein [Spirochaetales bacterium]